MSQPDDDPNARRALNQLTRLARDTVQRPTSAELDRGLNLVFARAAANPSRRARVVRWSLAGVCAALCALLAIQLTSVWRGRASELPTLAYRVEGGSVLAGGYLRDAGSGGIRLFFNEGTKIELQPGARGRLRSVDQEGTRIVLDQGSASFDVARSKERRWLVEAGPFSVAVKGTLFTVSWAPQSESFELRLQHGSVVVSGPMPGGDIELRAGQRLLVDLPKQQTLITEDHAGTAPSATTTPKDTPATIPSSTVATANSGSKLERKASWADHLAHGRWDRILEEAEQKGIDATLDSASSEDLFALADAARYRRRTDLARAALLAQRRRFPGSSRSVDAAFLLGRVEESRDRARAISWYDEYLARAAAGTYSAEAWGRKMVLTNELNGRASARPIAEEYLRRFPKGSYVGAARALTSEP
jgi:hypothetical protein